MVALKGEYPAHLRLVDGAAPEKQKQHPLQTHLRAAIERDHGEHATIVGSLDELQAHLSARGFSVARLAQKLVAEARAFLKIMPSIAGQVGPQLGHVRRILEARLRGEILQYKFMKPVPPGTQCQLTAMTGILGAEGAYMGPLMDALSEDIFVNSHELGQVAAIDRHVVKDAFRLAASIRDIHQSTGVRTILIAHSEGQIICEMAHQLLVSWGLEDAIAGVISICGFGNASLPLHTAMAARAGIRLGLLPNLQCSLDYGAFSPMPPHLAARHVSIAIDGGREGDTVLTAKSAFRENALNVLAHDDHYGHTSSVVNPNSRAAQILRTAVRTVRDYPPSLEVVS